MLKSFSKKWIIGSIVALGSVGLVATGFATWVIGTQSLKDQEDITVNVETAENQSVKLTATLGTTNSTLSLRDKKNDAPSETDIINATGAEEADLTISFDNITIECGKSYYDQHFANNKPFNLNLSSTDSKNDGSAHNETQLHKGNSYLNLTKGLVYTPAGGAWTNTDTKPKLSITSVSYEFAWGDYFEGKSPAKFYNDNHARLDGKLDEVVTELNAMYTALNGKTLTLVMELVPGTVE